MLSSLFARGKIPGKAEELQAHPYLKKSISLPEHYLAIEILMNILLAPIRWTFLELHCQCETRNGFC